MNIISLLKKILVKIILVNKIFARKRLATTGLLVAAALTSVTPAQADFGLSGIEFSPVRTFASANAHGYRTYSGTINFELSDPTTELSIPFLWSKAENSIIHSDGYESLVMDLQWRKFDEPTRSGGYVGVLVRGINVENRDTNDKAQNLSETDIGVGILAGFRRNISSGFYWGANLSLVAFADEPNTVRDGESNLFRQKVSLTADFLKIGYQF